MKKSILSLVMAWILVALWWQPAHAIPAFARKYKTSCSTCHYAFPKLNAFGRAFKANGFRYPAGTDEDFIKEEPVDMGADGQKRVFPDAIWPADIAGSSPVSFHWIQRAHFHENAPKVSFEFPHEMGLLAGGTIGESFSYFGEFELEHTEELGYSFWVQYDRRPEFHIRLGNVDPMPIPDGPRFTKEHYAYGSIRAVSNGNSGGNSRWRFRSGQNGISLWGRTSGAGGKGGFRYNVGVVNGQNDSENDDVNSAVDFFARASYKLGGLSEIGGTEGQASAKSAFWRDNSARIGAFTYLGKSTYAGFDDSFQVAGGMWDLWYDRLNVFGTYLWQKDKDVDKAAGKQEKISKAIMSEAHGVIYPWLIGMVRYEWTKVGSSATANKTLTPGIIAMLRANIRLTCQGILPLNNRTGRDWEYVAQVDTSF